MKVQYIIDSNKTTNMNVIKLQQNITTNKLHQNNR